MLEKEAPRKINYYETKWTFKNWIPTDFSHVYNLLKTKFTGMYTFNAKSDLMSHMWKLIYWGTGPYRLLSLQALV